MTGYNLRSPRLAIFLTTVCLILTAATFLGKSGAERLPDRATPVAGATNRPVTEADASKIREAYGRLPMTFEENRGQIPSSPGSANATRFAARGAGYSLLLADTEATLVLPEKRGDSKARGASPVVRLRWLGANTGTRLKAERPQGARSNYFHGSDPKNWRTAIPHYQQVRSASIYPGIDLLYYGNQRQLEYDLEVAPGADPGRAQLALDGVERASVAKNGDLVLTVAGRKLRQLRPVAYQEAAAPGASRETVKASYRLLPRAKGEPVRVAFNLGDYDHDRKLVIDPILRYSTLLGAALDDYGLGIAVDATGSAYVTGYTGSFSRAENAGPNGIDATPKFNIVPRLTAFPTLNEFSGNPELRFREFNLDADTNNTPDLTLFLGWYDAFITRFNPTGSALLYSTYLGSFVGGGDTYGTAIALNGAGEAYITGMTRTTGFPLVRPIQATSGGNGDGFITVLSQNGSSLVYSTYFGGVGTDIGRSIALDSNGNTLVTGLTTSPNLPVFNAMQPTYGGTQDQFVLNLDATGSAFNYFTYLGGSGFEGGVGPDHGLTPYTISIGSKTINSTPPRTFGGAFFSVFSQRLGSDFGAAAVFDSTGNAYITGGTSSANFPTLNPMQSSLSGSSDAFVTKLNGFGQLVYSTYLGGTGDDGGRTIAVDSAGSAYAAGYTSSTNFPTANPFQATNRGGFDAFVTKLNPAGNGLVSSTYLGGNGNDFAYGITVDSGRNPYVVGSTASSNFPVLNQVQGSLIGGQDIFLTKLSAPMNTVEYSTYLSGEGTDWGTAIAIDSQGSAFVTGIVTFFNMVDGPGYPTTLGAFQPFSDQHVPFQEGARRQLPTPTSDFGSYPLAEAFVTRVGNPPLAPTNLATTFVSQTQVDLAWFDNSANEIDFVVERKDPGGNFIQIATVPANQVTFSNGGLIPSTTYVYRVAARNQDGLSAYTNQVTVTTLPSLPAAPTNLSVSPIDRSRLLLSWTDNSNNETAFRIERRTGSDPFAEVAAVGPNISTFTDSALTSNTTYEYRVRANNSAGFSNYSNTASGTTLPDPPANPPLNLTATAVSNTQIDLLWQNDNPSVTGYKIERAVQGGNFQLIRQTVGPATTFSDMGLPSQTTFLYRVSAYNVSGDGPTSNVAQATTLEAPPTAPTNLQATVVSATRVDLSWNDTAGNETGFVVERSTDGVNFTQVGTTGANVTTFSDTTTAADTVYSYRVLATRNGSNSGASNVAIAVTPPLPPSNLSANAVTNSRIDLTWTDGSQTEAGFRIEQSTDGVNFILAGATGPGITSFPVTGLNASTQYFFRVIAFNSGGDSTPSNIATATTGPNPPVAPVGLAASVVSANRVDLVWTDTATETGFRILRSTNGGNPVTIGTTGMNVTAFADTTTVADTNYAYQVIAFNSGGDSGVSNTAFATTPPTAPTNTSATVVSANQVNVGWTDTSATETGFRIVRSTNGGAFVPVGTVGANVTTFADTTTVADRNYAYQVIAFNSGGDSAASSVAQATTPPSAPAGLTATTMSQNRIDLAWQSSAQTETGFRVEQSLDGFNFTPVGTTGPNVTAFQVNGLIASTQYFFRVIAFNGGGDSAASNVATATTFRNPPRAPGQLRAFVRTATQIDLLWSDLSTDELQFVIQRRTATIGFATIGTVGPNVTQFTDSGRVANTTYIYRVFASNDGGLSLPSNEASATIPRAGGRLAVNPTRLAFPITPSGRDSFLALTIRNTGTQTVSGKIGALNSPFSVFLNGFAILPNSGYFTLARGQSLRLNVVFRGTPGRFTSSLVIESSAPRVAVPITAQGR